MIVDLFCVPSSSKGRGFDQMGGRAVFAGLRAIGGDYSDYEILLT